MKGLIFLMGLFPLTMLAESATPITRARADSMVAAEMAAKQARHEAEKIDFTVLQRRSYDLGDRTFTVERAAPPNLPKPEAEPERTPPTAAEQLAYRQMIREAQQTRWISLAAVVYDNYGTPITHLRWQHDGQRYAAWSEADFNLLRTVRDFSGEGRKYQLAIFIFNECGAETILGAESPVERHHADLLD